ncbi:tRNA pseudouridine(55) synthase TruB [Thioflexithrix psekupsensis]|uniref:tRNA pseudouridine synthase B n=1 Tax=Thioflexithrix psekupsensis TaxID=1570016 RepID=A0A251XBK9_9GAMM|nr:tRNA pseudouridine(55) synthase TruB [Thioflexithrix psekupsensis]OUD15305.1 tRNA pseudouridine(55) synthase TruB [Thioflexithrix psekupsensis]
MSKLRGRRIDGILLLDKPTGISSNAALQQAKRLFQAQKAGHTGSLDNLATGLLPICFGEATKLSGFLLAADKGYIADCRLGYNTDTGDAEGQIIQQRALPELLDAEKIQAIFAEFLGIQQQIPPMYSALKQQGQPLYKLARQGKTVARAPRTIEIIALTLLSFSGEQLQFHVHCSKGTYVRTLAEDIGERLGCGAYLTALRRVTVGDYREMYSFSQLESILQAQGMSGLDQCLLPLETALPHFAVLCVSPAEALRLTQGQRIAVETCYCAGTSVCLHREEGENRVFFGLGEIAVTEEGEYVVMPKRLLNEA